MEVLSLGLEIRVWNSGDTDWKKNWGIFIYIKAPALILVGIANSTQKRGNGTERWG
jgi:hypothetical protein